MKNPINKLVEIKNKMTKETERKILITSAVIGIVAGIADQFVKRFPITEILWLIVIAAVSAMFFVSIPKIKSEKTVTEETNKVEKPEGRKNIKQPLFTVAFLVTVIVLIPAVTYFIWGTKGIFFCVLSSPVWGVLAFIAYCRIMPLLRKIDKERQNEP